MPEGAGVKEVNPSLSTTYCRYSYLVGTCIIGSGIIKKDSGMIKKHSYDKTSVSFSPKRSWEEVWWCP